MSDHTETGVNRGVLQQFKFFKFFKFFKSERRQRLRRPEQSSFFQVERRRRLRAVRQLEKLDFCEDAVFES